MTNLHEAAGSLLGLTLEGGWVVVEEAGRSVDATGGQSSRGYIVRSVDGQRAFLKALDYSHALDSDDVPGELARAASSYVHERSILRRCEQRRLDRIVRALDFGQVRVDGVSGIPTVDYIILELAEADVRAYIDGDQSLTVGWALRTLHHVAVGLSQLHGHRIAHQDVKPSNVLVFDERSTKIGDLGRALARDLDSPFDEHLVVGTPLYAPIELLYGQNYADWTRRCQSCDMYLLGSLMLFLFANAGMTPALLTKLPQEFWPGTWGGEYRDVLPYLRAAYSEVLAQFQSGLPSPIADPLLSTIRELCDPDPELRGHPKTRASAGSSYSLERYIALLDHLSRRCDTAGIADRIRDVGD